jgi:tetratricopeptide (TPR) repeat protein
MLEPARRVVEIRRKTLGVQHEAYGAAVNNLGATLCQLGQCEEGLLHFEEALDVFEQSDGPNSPRAAYALLGIARAYSSLQRHAEAIEASTRSVALRDELGSPPDELCGSLRAHVDVLTAAGRRSDAAKANARAANVCTPGR